MLIADRIIDFLKQPERVIGGNYTAKQLAGSFQDQSGSQPTTSAIVASRLSTSL